jgi:hypothetical protein
LQRQEQALLRALGQGLARWLLRDEDRVLFKVQEQHVEQALLRFNERRLVRGLDMGLVQGLLQ